jgi:hypothetical protein
MLCLHGDSVLALDGTGYVSSKTMHWKSCLHKVHRHGSITYYHQRLGAALLPPAFRAVIPRMPEPMMKQDGTAKHDGERKAANRFIVTPRQAPPPLPCIVTEDGLRANAPHIETLHAHGGHSMLGVKEGDHVSRFTQGQAAEAGGRVTSYERHDRAAGVGHRFRFVHDGPLKASRAAVRVTFIAYGEMRKDKGPQVSWVTDVRVSQRHVSQRMRGGRARWKMEKETCNTLKNQGDNCEHNDGHGEENLSGGFATIMRRAFVVDHTPQLCCALFQAVWANLGSKRLRWERLRALCYGDHLESMRELLEALLYGYERHRPVWITDTS